MTTRPQDTRRSRATADAQRSSGASRALGGVVGLGRDAAVAAGAGAGRVLAGLFGTVARVRHDRPLHPRGVTYEAELTVTGGGRTGVSVLDEPGTHHATLRVSRAVGLPPRLPDVYGIALRLGPGTSTPADLLFATTGRSAVGRFVLQPRTHLGSASLTTLLPLRSPAGPLVLRLAADGEPSVAEGSLPHRMVLSCAVGTGSWRQVGMVHVGPESTAGEDAERHDPLVHQLPGTEQYPLVRRLREPAYLAARRNAEPAVGADEQRRQSPGR